MQNNLTDSIRQILEAYSGLQLIIVYGSAVTESFRNESDIDIAVLFDQPLDPELKLELLGKLAVALKREIDLVDLFKLNGVLLKQILTKGQIIYKRSDNAVCQLLKRMIYNQSDFMPYYNKAIRRRVQEFVDG